MKQPGRGTHGAALQSQPLGTRDDTQLLIAAAAANGIETVRLKVRKELLIRTFNKKSFSVASSCGHDITV